MRPGTLRHRLTLSAFTTAKNDFGEDVPTFANYATVWGSFEPLLGREYFASQQMQSPAEAKVRIRYLSTVKDEDRVAFDGTTYEILGVQNVENRDRELLLYVREVKP